MEIYSNGIGQADDEFIEKVLLFFQSHSNQYFTAMTVKKKTGLTKTAVILSINELVFQDKLEKKIENQKNLFKLKVEE